MGGAFRGPHKWDAFFIAILLTCKTMPDTIYSVVAQKEAKEYHIRDIYPVILFDCGRSLIF